MKCPKCSLECIRDEVNIGVGIAYSPWGCNNCGWREEDEINKMFETKEWQSMDSAPKDKDILVLMQDGKVRKEVIVHYAEGGGEDQPPYEGWFYWNDCMYINIDLKYCKWKPVSK